MAHTLLLLFLFGCSFVFATADFNGHWKGTMSLFGKNVPVEADINQIPTVSEKAYAGTIRFTSSEFSFSTYAHILPKANFHSAAWVELSGKKTQLIISLTAKGSENYPTSLEGEIRAPTLTDDPIATVQLEPTGNSRGRSYSGVLQFFDIAPFAAPKRYFFLISRFDDGVAISSFHSYGPSSSSATGVQGKLGSGGALTFHLGSLVLVGTLSMEGYYGDTYEGIPNESGIGKKNGFFVANFSTGLPKSRASAVGENIK